MKKIFKKLCITLICIVTIILPIKVNAAGIVLNNSSLVLGPNTSEILGFTLDEGLKNYNVSWKSSNNNIITVENGKVTAVASEGTAIITASINGQSSTCKITISPEYIPVNGITLSKSNISILIGTTEKIISNISPSDATNKEVVWKSYDTSIATVDRDGKITAKKPGTTTITASASNGKQTTCKVTVVNNIPLNKIELNKEELTIKEKSSEKLNLTFVPSNATNKKVTWKSSNTNIVTIDSTGKINGIKPGTATITVISNDGGYVAICKVKVEAISKKVTSVSLDKKEIKIVSGEKFTLKATINPNYAENKNVLWKSNDEKIVTVENGVVTAVTPGTTQIVVTSEDGEKTATCNVIVTPPPIKGISFKNIEETIYLNSETTLNVINDPVTSVLENLVWKSSDEKVATVENGVVRALSIGQTIITVSTEDNKLTASININVINKPKDKLNITIEGYDINFDPEIKNYNLTIKNESKLKISTNIDNDKITINGNQNLKNGSIVTISVVDEERVTYVINIKKKQNYTIYFIAIISVLLLINLIRIMVKNKKKKH